MRFGEMIEFRKDLYFEGAVQIDWFYDPAKASKVAENFVFHGKNYFGVDDSSINGKKRIDTISLVERLTEKLNDESVKVPSLAIADYGTGKSHLSVTLGQLFSGPSYMPETFNKIIDNIRTIDSDAAEKIAQNCDGRNFVMVINGMKDFNLHSEILKAAQKSLALYGLSDENLRKLNRALTTAELFFERNIKNSISIFESAAKAVGWNEKGDALEQRIKRELLTSDDAFEIVNTAYKEINGQEIRWDEGLSASSILDMLVSEYCGINGKFDHIVILFDEFGRYLEYASGVNAAKSGDSALQQIFESIQNSEGVLQVINFIQSDIKTYLQRIDQTKNISRYIGRYDGSEKFYISSNLETVFANLIQRTDKEAFQKTIVTWQDKKEAVWKEYFEFLNKWLITKGMWKDYKMFRKVVVEGIYPMHPLSTYMLTQLSDYLQNRSSLTLISQYIESLSQEEIGRTPKMITPEQLMRGDLYVEMLAAEQDGKQPSQQCIRFDGIIRKIGDKLSEKSLMVLRANLILRILRFRTTDYDDAKMALAFASGLSTDEVEEELKWLVTEYAVLGFDEHAGCFDFMEESNGAHDFKILKNRLISAAKVEKSYINNLKIQELAEISNLQTTNFATTHKISTNEWQFKQEMYPIEEFTEVKADSYVTDWRNATTSIAPKGRLIWLYINKDTEPTALTAAQKLIHKFNGLPIVIMAINDDDNRLYNCLVEYYVFETMDDAVRTRYSRHFDDGFNQVKNNLKDEFEELKKQRLRVLDEDIKPINGRMASFLTEVFEGIYPNAVPFWFDGFVTKGNNLGGKGGTYFCSIIKMLLSGSVNSDSIHNFSSDIRNRIESVLMTSSNTSWKCINDEYRLIPPENKSAKLVYEKITNELEQNNEINCSAIFDTYSKPPYGMSEDVITLMLAVICANMNYCLRINYLGNVKNINIWKDIVVVKDKKIDIEAIKKSIFIVIDAGEVVGKYKRLFAKIRDNRNIYEVNHLTKELERMTEADEVPEEIETEYLLAKNLLSHGMSAKNSWNEALQNIEEQYYEFEDGNGSELYPILKALEALEELDISKYFDENGFEFDSESKSRVKDLRDNIVGLINDNIDNHISSMLCKNVESMKTFRNHNTKIQVLLDELGFTEYANRVKVQREKELANVEGIKSRAELRGDCLKFLNDSKIEKFTTYLVIKDYAKKGKELQERIQKFGDSLGKDGDSIQNNINQRVSELEKQKNRVEQDITDIWDDLTEVQQKEDIDDLHERIALVLQRGLSSNDQSALEEVDENLLSILDDISIISNTDISREELYKTAEDIKEKYKDDEGDFDVIAVIDEAVKNTEEQLKQKEDAWIIANLNLGNKSRSSIHMWKENIKYLPKYLTPETIKKVRKMDQEADELITEGKIEDVIFYFDKLNAEEKAECIKKLSKMLQEEEEENENTQNKNPENNTSKNAGKYGQFDSWTIKSDTIAIKETDKSVFNYNSSGIPADIKWFFDVDDYAPGERIDIELVFEEKSYKAYAKQDLKGGRAKIMWFSDLGSALNDYYDTSADYPLMVFERKGKNKYNITIKHN